MDKMMILKLEDATKKFAHTGLDGHRGLLVQLHVMKEHKSVKDFVKEEILVKLDVRAMKHKLRIAMQEMESTAHGRHSLRALLHAKEDCNQGLELTHAKRMSHKQLLATLTLEHTTHGLHGLLVQKLAEAVHNRDDVIIHVVILINHKIKLVIQIQVILVLGLHGASAPLHAVVVHKQDQEFIHVLENISTELKNVTHNLALSGVVGHSGDSAVQHAVTEKGYDTDSVEVDLLEVVSA